MLPSLNKAIIFLTYLLTYCPYSLTQTAVRNIYLNCIAFINLTFRMLQHTSSEVIIIQLQINLNPNIQLYGLGTNDKNMLIIEIKFLTANALKLGKRLGTRLRCDFS